MNPHTSAPQAPDQKVEPAEQEAGVNVRQSGRVPPELDYLEKLVESACRRLESVIQNRRNEDKVLPGLHNEFSQLLIQLQSLASLYAQGTSKLVL